MINHRGYFSDHGLFGPFRGGAFTRSMSRQKEFPFPFPPGWQTRVGAVHRREKSSPDRRIPQRLAERSIFVFSRVES